MLRYNYVLMLNYDIREIRFSDNLGGQSRPSISPALKRWAETRKIIPEGIPLFLSENQKQNPQTAIYHESLPR